MCVLFLLLRGDRGGCYIDSYHPGKIMRWRYMATQRLCRMKPAFLEDVIVLSFRDSHQVWERIKALVQDPAADGRTKFAIRHVFKYLRGPVFRQRCGRYRI